MRKMLLLAFIVPVCSLDGFGPAIGYCRIIRRRCVARDCISADNRRNSRIPRWYSSARGRCSNASFPPSGVPARHVCCRNWRSRVNACGRWSRHFRTLFAYFEFFVPDPEGLDGCDSYWRRSGIFPNAQGVRSLLRRLETTVVGSEIAPDEQPICRTRRTLFTTRSEDARSHSRRPRPDVLCD